MHITSRIYIAGHRGLAGSAFVRCLTNAGYTNLLTSPHSELDLEDAGAVDRFFQDSKPDYVFLAAAKVGGIHANSTYPVDFLLRNLRIEANVIEASWRHEVKGLLFLGSSCIYPRMAPQPMKEEYLLTGPLEPTNEPYAIAKIAGVELCEAYHRQYGARFLSVMPTNMYGPNDNYDLTGSHVLPALIRKFHLAKLALEGSIESIQKDENRYGPIPDEFRSFLEEACAVGSSSAQSSRESIPALPLWGSGAPRREFLHSDDLADACLFLMNRLEDIFSDGAPRQSTSSTAPSLAARHLFNVGTGKDSTIREVAELIASIAGYEAPIGWDTSKPDGTPQKLLDVSRMSSLGWSSKISLKEGIRSTYKSYIETSLGHSSR